MRALGTTRVKVRRRPWPADAALDKPVGDLDDPVLYGQSVVSPLRYPGAKRQLFGALSQMISVNVPPPRLLVEPFCGGATSALKLAGTGLVEHVVLADADPLIAAFWYTAAFDTSWLTAAMKEEDVTIERWDWWRLSTPKARRDRALKCLFLNRTTFSGILHGRAGPIGGRAQTSPYKIDCRYGVAGLERRINAIGALANTARLLDVWNSDWRDTIRRVKKEFSSLSRDEIVLYLDPPYVEKAPTLYDWSFDSDEHIALADTLLKSEDFRWLLSYDDNAVIRQLYESAERCTMRTLVYRYTAAGSKSRKAKAELLVTNFSEVPESLGAM